MKVVVWGLGRVGAVTAACLSRFGHEVAGFDIDPEVRRGIADGRAQVAEPGLDELLSEAVRQRKLTLHDDPNRALRDTAASLVCVSTKETAAGELDTSAVERSVAAIANALRPHRFDHTIVIRSTVPPGTTRRLRNLALEKSTRSGSFLSAAFNPEFFRSGRAVSDFNNPPLVVAGADEEIVADRLRQLYSPLSAPVHLLGLEEAEVLKLACNAFHALKIAFANEVGRVCKTVRADASEVMRVFREDGRLNASAAYLVPGAAFDGPCLSKDTAALTRVGSLGADLPVLSAILPSNAIQRCFDVKKRVGSSARLDHPKPAKRRVADETPRARGYSGI